MLGRHAYLVGYFAHGESSLANQSETMTQPDDAFQNVSSFHAWCYLRIAHEEIGEYDAAWGDTLEEFGRGNAYTLTNVDIIDPAKEYTIISQYDEADIKAWEPGETPKLGMTITNATQADNSIYFSISGMKTTKPQKGIYIHNGKKVVLK